MMDGKNRRHASAFTVRVSICPLARQRTSGRCHQERSAANANRGVSTKTEAPAADGLGSGILGHLRSVWSDWRHPLLYVQETLSSVSSANGSADFGPGCPSRSADVEVGPAPPQNSAD
jgi:hypothetical protein